MVTFYTTNIFFLSQSFLFIFSSHRHTMKVVIKKSDRPGKKLMAIFTKDTGRTKTTYFGKAGMDD